MHGERLDRQKDRQREKDILRPVTETMPTFPAHMNIPCGRYFLSPPKLIMNVHADDEVQKVASSHIASFLHRRDGDTTICDVIYDEPRR